MARKRNQLQSEKSVSYRDTSTRLLRLDRGSQRDFSEGGHLSRMKTLIIYLKILTKIPIGVVNLTKPQMGRGSWCV
jgi:hypothetical protein